MYRKLIPLVCLAAITGCDSDSITEAEAGADRIREAFGAYQNVSQAQAAGYAVWSPDPFAAGATCASAPEGKMGYHLVNVPLRGAATTPQTGDAVIDPMKPEMLLYEKRSDGTMSLVGVEWIVFKAAWEREKGVGAAPPQVLGQPLLYSEHTFAPGGPVVPHYELHAWIFKDNPRGTFDPWHPGVTC
ncbi:MAG: hypothetical protein H0T48_16585 [Gemmatimonadaceae bacterium]|nr:hypothetical protein [Gemmatimonadaceae bacterium]